MQQKWARIGAAARLAEIDRERAEILKSFPELSKSSALGPSGKPRRQFSAAARRRMSAGMRKFWARRKAAAARG
jgi:hypothetical protein